MKIEAARPFVCTTPLFFEAALGRPPMARALRRTACGTYSTSTQPKHVGLRQGIEVKICLRCLLFLVVVGVKPEVLEEICGDALPSYQAVIICTRKQKLLPRKDTYDKGRNAVEI